MTAKRKLRIKVLQIGHGLNKWVCITISAHFRQHKIALVYEIVSANVPGWHSIIRYDWNKLFITL